MNKKIVFLSGMIDGVTLHESSAWRQQATKILEAAGFATYDPTKVIRETEKYIAQPNEIYTNDTFNLSRADIMLVNMDLPQIIKTQDAPFFTIGEMFLAHQAGKPIITFGNTFKGRNAYEAIVTKNFPTLLEAVDYIISRLLPISAVLKFHEAQKLDMPLSLFVM